jgi:hypothetical protein
MNTFNSNSIGLPRPIITTNLNRSPKRATTKMKYIIQSQMKIERELADLGYMFVTGQISQYQFDKIREMCGVYSNVGLGIQTCDNN